MSTALGLGLSFIFPSADGAKGGTPGSSGLIELEDASGHVELEDGSGSVGLE